VLASFIRSPLEEAANPLVTPNPAKAPWYFLWLQEIVTDTTFTIGGFTVNGAFLGGVILPTLILGLLTAWPWLDRSPAEATGVWFHGSRRKQNAAFLLAVLVVVLLTIVGTFLRGPSWEFFWPWQAWPELPTRI
jgi:quinol-cytochrome oxidoreductase complex cytochrome b subunit